MFRTYIKIAVCLLSSLVLFSSASKKESKTSFNRDMLLSLENPSGSFVSNDPVKTPGTLARSIRMIPAAAILTD